MYRLENLYTFKKIDLKIPNATFSYAIKQGNVCYLTIDSGSAFFGKTEGSLLFTLPDNLKPYDSLAFSAPGISTSNFMGAKLYTNGTCKLLSTQKLNDSFYITISYICSNFN